MNLWWTRQAASSQQTKKQPFFSACLINGLLKAGSQQRFAERQAPK